MDSTSILYSKTSPATFLEWLEYQERLSTDYSVNFRQYQDYVKKWSSNYNNKDGDSKNLFFRLYIDLLREITLNYSTEEEKRFIINFDFSKTDNLDIIIPFFIDKIKNICVFYSNKREELKDVISQIPIKGTNISVKKVVKNIILNELDNKNSQKESEGRITFPSLSAINRNLEVKIEELFDTTNYYEYKRETTGEFKDLGNIDIDPNIYIDFKEAIKEAIRQYPLFIESLLGNFSINYTLSGNELDLLNSRDFISYINTLSSEDLKIDFKRKLAPKYVSSDFYYLSVGNTINDIISGTLFSTKPLTGSNIQNLSNRYESKIAAVQSFDNLYTVYELGKFFIPNHSGVLQYNAFNKNYFLNYNKLTPNSVYVFPDPNIIEGKDSPILYKVYVDWNKIGFEGGAAFGNVITDSYYQRFYGYESYSQDIGNTPHGLSLSNDNVDFWSGDKDSIWTEQDLWPGLDKVDRLPLQSRLESLLLDRGELTEWYYDIYGNQFGLYKELNNNYTLYDKKKNYTGEVFVKNTATDLVSSFKHFFNKTFLKYPQYIYNELIRPIKSFYLIKNVFVVETDNYVVIDSYDYNFEDGSFINTLLPGIYIPKHEINDSLEKYINSFYVESKNKIYFCFTKLMPELSASNYKSIVPVIYELDVDGLNFLQKYPSLKFDTSFYSLSSNLFKEYPEVDLRKIEGGKFSFKEKFDLFNLTYFAFNLNNIPFIINEQFSLEEGNNYLHSYGSLFNKPYMYVHDLNYANPDVDHTVRYTATYSELVGSKDNVKFKWEVPDLRGENSHFCSNINPVIINKPGSHYVQFDWDKYILGNVFIGCEAISVANVDGNNIIGFRDNTPSILLNEDEKIYKIRDYTFFGFNFSLSASRPYNTNGNIVHFTISSDTSGFEGNFCNNLYSIYRKVFVEIVGDGGVGSVGGDPACLDCPPVCEFVYPLYSTITLIPSAGYRSAFAGWLGAPCEGLAGNCAITVTDTTYISAVFNKIPFYKLRVTTDLPGTTVTTTDGNINCGEVCEFEYQENTIVGVSAGPAPRGYQFLTFKGGPLCGINNPCGITMTQNYTITANYVLSLYDIILKKEYLNLEYGPILIRTENGGSRTLLPSITTLPGGSMYDRQFFYSKNTSGLVGSITCSLSPDVPIYAYAEFLSTPRLEFVSLTGRGGGNYIFNRYIGNPCSNIRSRICSFFVTSNYSITGVITVPAYTLSIAPSGNGVFYIESEDGLINCGTRGFSNTRRDCFETYLSGTFVSLSGICAPGSVLYALCASDKFRIDNYPIGQDTMNLNLYVEGDTVVTAAGGAEINRTLTVIKSGADIEKVKNSDIIVRVAGFRDFVMDRNIEREEYLLSFLSEIVIDPVRVPENHRHLYTVGFSGLYYKYDGYGLTFTPQTTAVIDIDESINSINSVIELDGSSAPIYTELSLQSPITVFNRESYMTLNANATAFVVFESIDFLAKQESIEDPIYTQDLRLIFTK